MGMCLDPTPEMDGFEVEVRRFSAYIRGPDMCAHEDQYGVGEIEINLTDLPKLEAAIAQIKEHLAEKKDGAE